MSDPYYLIERTKDGIEEWWVYPPHRHVVIFTTDPTQAARFPTRESAHGAMVNQMPRSGRLGQWRVAAR